MRTQKIVFCVCGFGFGFETLKRQNGICFGFKNHF